MDGTVCGRGYRAEVTVQDMRPRIIVDGITHPKGQPIRFKSVKRAENHIRNMGLELPQ